ncbi:helix-turn-helix transcriptional regulator, partial [Streptomyces sp. SID3343]|uniref:helix-turn-helix domain-containing protein n=1 Tax=Streptomyces sp. SID3343 TaxID=2690260 RepID=UPI00136B227E
CFERAGASRREFAKAAFLDPSAITRYFKGQRVAPRDFLDKLAAFLADRGTPLTPEEHDRLDRLCTTALAGGSRQGDQVLYWKEEAARLAATKTALTARWHEERERGVLDRRRADEILGALELELAELRERLEHTETQRDTLRDRVREQDRRLHAAADYAR